MREDTVRLPFQLTNRHREQNCLKLSDCLDLAQILTWCVAFYTFSNIPKLHNGTQDPLVRIIPQAAEGAQLPLKGKLQRWDGEIT